MPPAPRPVVCRFAPSPTGFLHAGNLRVGLLNYLYARHHGGQFILRLDDTDSERSKKEYEDGIKEDLAWLGLDYDAVYRQSDRLALYQAAAEQLKKSGRLYACYETTEELALLRKSQESAGRPPHYDRRALSLSRAAIAELEAAGRKPHYRFLLNDQETAWHDLGKGDVRFAKNIVSDPVLIRADGLPLYTLSSVVDDGLLGITLILRGDDHLTNSAAQIQLFEALGYPPPMMAHLPRMVDGQGGKLSKRLGAKSIRDLRRAGVHPRALLAYLGHLGLSTGGRGEETLADLIKTIAIEKFGKAEPKFFENDLLTLNKKILSGLDFPAASQFYGATAMGSLTADEWQKLRGGVSTAAETAAWREVIKGDIATPSAPFTEDEKKFLSLIADHLPKGLTPASVEDFLEKIKNLSSRKGKEFFHPIRLALTNRLDGPTIADIFLLLPRATILTRLRRCC